VPAVIIITLLVLWRLKLGMLMLAALAGWSTIGALLFGVVIVGLAALRERRAGRPF
jgi:hypothetical protein